MTPKQWSFDLFGYEEPSQMLDTALEQYMTPEWAKMFSLEQRIIPQTLFPRLQCPLNWVVFTKERVRRMFGFLLFPEDAELQDVSKAAKLVLVHGKPKRGAWRAVVDAALEACGGEADLAAIYDFIAPRRPSGNEHWRERVRATLQQGNYRPVARGRWAIAA